MALKRKSKTGETDGSDQPFVPYNKGRVIGAKDIFTPDQIQMVKLRLTQERKERDWLLFSLGVNGRLRVGDLSALKVDDVASEAGGPDLHIGT